jgi:hypothetical protein
MRTTFLAPMRRRALAGFGLALFLLGINYCLVGALIPTAGAGMPCMPAPTPTVHADAAKPAAHAGHCAGMAQTGGEEAPSTAPAPPCCIALTPVLAPEAGKVSLPLIALLDLPLVAPEICAAPERGGELLRAPPESPPHLAVHRAPSSPRAPPTI